MFTMIRNYSERKSKGSNNSVWETEYTHRNRSV